MEEFPPVAIDERGGSHRLTEKIGEGGQGAVYLTNNERIAVKLASHSTSEAREQLESQLQAIQLLPLDRIPIAHPLETLRAPHLGYVMEFLTGYDASVDVDESAGLTMRRQRSGTLEGGGMARRLRLLARAAEALLELHSQALVYADPSPNNIFVSEDVSAHEVWFIDADNLRYQSEAGRYGFYTFGYGAPELVNKKSGVTTLTDAHAFAVLAFETLTMQHPLLGDAVQDGEAELEDQALAGKWPWIDDPADDRNHSARRIPREWVLTRDLRALCQETFGEGLNHPRKRPGMARWVELLHKAADIALPCPPLWIDVLSPDVLMPLAPSSPRRICTDHNAAMDSAFQVWRWIQ